LSLALWGSNCLDYLKEAHRILEDDGILIIIEPSGRWLEENEYGERVNKLEKEIIKEGKFQIRDIEVKKFMFIKAARN
jgi:hypothetical protein